MKTKLILFLVLTILTFFATRYLNQIKNSSLTSSSTEKQVDTSEFDLEFEFNEELGEYKIEGEDEIFARYIQIFNEHFLKKYVDEGKPAKRAVHAKSHGCMRAKFIVDELLDPDLKHSVFKAPHPYDAIVRYSNGDGPPQRDNFKLNSVGIGVKILGVNSPKLLESQTENTVDLLMVNSPAFLVDDIRGFLDLIEARESGTLDVFSKGRFLKRQREGIAGRVLADKKDNPLKTDYWSVLPFQLGDVAVKYMIRAVDRSTTDLPAHLKLPEGYLRDLTKEYIESANAIYDVFIQKREIGKNGLTAEDLPIENAGIEWDEERTGVVKVGRLFIPKVPELNDIDEVNKDPFNDETYKNNYCEKLVFSPWNTTADFRPMSSLNRARRFVYELSARRRHQINETANPLDRE